MPRRTLILGLGNPLLCDDALGLIAARSLYKALAAHHGLAPVGLEPADAAPPLGELDYPCPALALPDGEEVGLAEAAVAGLGALDIVCGWNRVIFIDSIQTNDGVAGTLRRFGLEDFDDTVRTASPHDLNLASALAFGGEQGFAVPTEIAIYAIEAEDVLTFREELSETVAAALPGAVARMLREQFGIGDGAGAGSGV